MKRLFASLALTLAVGGFAAAASAPAHFGTCSGSGTCTACSSCSSCKRCHVLGLKCSVCRLADHDEQGK